VVTVTDLAKFLDEHGNPGTVIIHPQDFLAIQMNFISPEKRGTNVFWFLGVEWIRAEGPGGRLDWSDKRIYWEPPEVK